VVVVMNEYEHDLGKVPTSNESMETIIYLPSAMNGMHSHLQNRICIFFSAFIQ
jgi:hypothetical protein